MKNNGDNGQEEFRFHSHPWQRSTSKEAWDSVMTSGWASKMAKLGYAILYEIGPLTLLELEHEAARRMHHAPKGRSESTVIRRLYDLRDNDLVRLTSVIRKCGISGKNAVTWDVTEGLAPAVKLKPPGTVCPKCGYEIQTL